jgi:hypothetical protein
MSVKPELVGHHGVVITPGSGVPNTNVQSKSAQIPAVMKTRRRHRCSMGVCHEHHEPGPTTG